MWWDEMECKPKPSAPWHHNLKQMLSLTVEVQIDINRAVNANVAMYEPANSWWAHHRWRLSLASVNAYSTRNSFHFGSSTQPHSLTHSFILTIATKYFTLGFQQTFSAFNDWHLAFRHLPILTVSTRLIHSVSGTLIIYRTQHSAHCSSHPLQRVHRNY